MAILCTQLSFQRMHYDDSKDKWSCTAFGSEWSECTYSVIGFDNVQRSPLQIDFTTNPFLVLWSSYSGKVRNSCCHACSTERVMVRSHSPLPKTRVVSWRVSMPWSLVALHAHRVKCGKLSGDTEGACPLRYLQIRLYSSGEITESYRAQREMILILNILDKYQNKTKATRRSFTKEAKRWKKLDPLAFQL